MNLCKDCNIKEKYSSKTGKKYSYCYECHYKRIRKFQKTKNGKAAVAKAVRNHQRRKNGFTAELFNKIIQEQNYMCAICLKNIDESSHADHNHISGNPRGILCPGCNTLLGRIESVGFDWVDSAKEYLKKYS